jgi:hypothetical protein
VGGLFSETATALPPHENNLQEILLLVKIIAEITARQAYFGNESPLSNGR